MTTGAGAVVLTDEVLTLPDIAEWTAQIARQPSWSDFPLIILTLAGQVDRESQRKLLLRQPLGNLVLLERPVRPETLVSTVQAALRSRRRQYQIRDHLAERCKSEEALRKSEKLAVAGRLAASMAHEINNPLESVVNLLYLISKCSFPEESFKYTQMAMSELARVSEIVTQTLKFHRQQSKPGMVQITEIVESALALYQGRLISARIVIEKDFRECQPILAEIKKKLFEPFISTKGDTGTGLGLWVSYGIVQKHSGKIQVKSSAISPATGTVFSVFLPLQPQFDAISAPPDNLLITTGLISQQQSA
jgi:signal transduction histidine kinase